MSCPLCRVDQFHCTHTSQDFLEMDAWIDSQPPINLDEFIRLRTEPPIEIVLASEKAAVEFSEFMQF